MIPRPSRAQPNWPIAHSHEAGRSTSALPLFERLEENWGKPPAISTANGTNLLIYGKPLRPIFFVGVQPTFATKGDPMRLLYSRSAAPPTALPRIKLPWRRVWAPMRC